MLRQGCKSIPIVLPDGQGLSYPLGMGNNRERTPLDWGARFMRLLKAKHWTLAKLAPMLDLSEGALRHWTNGTRQITLTQFLQLCDAAEIDPGVVLFADKVDDKFLAIGEAWRQADNLGREVLWTAAQGILAKRGASAGDSRAATSFSPPRARARTRA